MIPAEIVAAGDACLSIAFPEAIDPRLNDRCVALAAELERCQIKDLRDVVPAYHTVSVFFDPRRTDRAALRRELEEAVRRSTAEIPTREPDPHEIHVSYGGEAGPDLVSIAEFSGLSPSEVVRLHADRTYRVYMLGFLPGFAYLGAVDSRIAMPRLETPRVRVPAGAVGIAGSQTGVYPCDSPGGWRIIGRTSAIMFDASREEPSTLQAGDRVKFVAV